MQDVKLMVVETYGSRPEADLAKGALEDAGIRAMIQADTAGGMREHLAWSGAGFRILVREEDATAARGSNHTAIRCAESRPHSWV
jgi:Putative prokaryotic signal transducing protein